MPIILAESSLVTDKWFRENKSLLENRILILCLKGLPDEQINVDIPVKTYMVAAPDGAIIGSGSFSFLNKKRVDFKKILKEHELKLIAKSKHGLVINSSDDDDDDDD